MTHARKPARRGSAMIEFALSMSLVLVPLLIATVEAGYGLYRYNAAYTAIRGGARYASLATFTAASSGTIETYKLAVQRMVAYGDPSASSGSTTVPGLTPERVTVDVLGINGQPASATNRPAIVRVQPSLQLDVFFHTWTLGTQLRATFPYVGRYTTN